MSHITTTKHNHNFFEHLQDGSVKPILNHKHLKRLQYQQVKPSCVAECSHAESSMSGSMSSSISAGSESASRRQTMDAGMTDAKAAGTGAGLPCITRLPRGALTKELSRSGQSSHHYLSLVVVAGPRPQLEIGAEDVRLLI